MNPKPRRLPRISIRLLKRDGQTTLAITVRLPGGARKVPPQLEQR